jgi:hypothetical protein
MTTLYSIANQVYGQYLKRGKGLHSPDEALWQLKEYMESNPDVTDTNVIVENVVILLLELDY